MATDEETQLSILEHCRDEFKPISPLIGEIAPKSTLYRAKDELVKAGLLDSDGKDRYRTSQQGVLKLVAMTEEIPTGLTSHYPPISHVPTRQHQALIELTLAAVIARKFSPRSDRHPTIIIAGPTLSWKTSLGIFLCHMLSLDPSSQVVNLAAESGRSLWLRKTSSGAIAYRRELLDTPFVVFDEYQSADSESKKLLRIWTDGRKNVAVENEKVTIQAVPVITLNPAKGESLEERLGVSRAQLRRSITCDLTGINLPNDLAVKGEDILAAAKSHEPLNLIKPQHDLTKYRSKTYELFLATLNAQGQELVDLEMLTMLSTAMTAYFDPVEATRLVFFDALLLFETLGWTKEGWMMHIKNFPTKTHPAVTGGSANSNAISDETWAEAFKFLDEGQAPTTLVTEKHLSPDIALLITKKHGELKGSEGKKPSKENSTGDVELQQMEREVKLADLKRQKAEHEKPLEIDKRIGELTAPIQEHGRWKQENCTWLDQGYCMGWQYDQKPNIPDQVGEPLLHTDGKWRVHPTYERCAACPIFLKKGTITQEDLTETVTQLEGAATQFGNWKRDHCSHLIADFCRYWRWSQKPNVSYQTGEPLQLKARWHINPSPTACASCHAYHERGTPSISNINEEIKRLRSDVDGIPLKDLRNRFKCKDCGATTLVAANVKCTKCDHEYWWGWHPNSKTEN